MNMNGTNNSKNKSEKKREEIEKMQISFQKYTCGALLVRHWYVPSQPVAHQ
jgi:hypothetical protein